MTAAVSIADAFGEGLRRERGLTERRDDWTRQDYLDRKDFLEQLIRDEDDRAELARLQGRLMAVCVEGERRFGG